MAEDNPELQQKLRALDRELEEGDITEKGYQKRRTLILSQFLNPTHVEQVQRGLRLHSPDDTAHPSRDGSRSASFAALTSRSDSSSHVPQTDSRLAAGHAPQVSANGQNMTDSREAPPLQDRTGRLRERELGVRNPSQEHSAYSHESYRPSSRRDMPGGYPFSQDSTRAPTIADSNYVFNPENEAEYTSQTAVELESPNGGETRQSTMLESHQSYFSDFAGHQSEGLRDSYGGGPHRYSTTDAFSPTAAMAPPMLRNSDLPPIGAISHQPPLEPRDVPFAVYDPHNENIPMSKFDNIAAVLRHRARTNSKQPAYWVLDQKGKEISSITWEKLASRAEKVAQVIRDKSNLYSGDRVALIYRDLEVIDFAVAFMGCFIAGVVAVPINYTNNDDYNRLNVVLTTTQAHLALTTDANLKNFQRDITANKLSWPRGVEWWKTNEFGDRKSVV